LAVVLVVPNASSRTIVSDAPKVWIVVVNWRRREDTLECLRSVAGLDYPNHNVVFVDNGSEDGSVEAVRHLYPACAVIVHRRNLGFTGGNNAGIRYALEHGADYVWLLNNDAIVASNALTELVRLAEQDRFVAMVSPLVMYMDEPNRVQFNGAVIDRQRYEVLRSQEADDTNLVLSGAALLIRATAVREVGLLRDDFFAYWEDIEYSERVLACGYRNRVAQKAFVFHKNPPWTENELHRSAAYYFYMTRNACWFWLPRTPVWRWPMFFRRYLSRAVETIHLAESTGASEIVEACWDGLWAGARGLGGERDVNTRMPRLVKIAILATERLWKRLARFGSGRTLERVA